MAIAMSSTPTLAPLFHPTPVLVDGVQHRPPIFDLSWEYATYLLLNQNAIESQHLLSKQLFPASFMPSFLPSNANYGLSCNDMKSSNFDTSTQITSSLPNLRDHQSSHVTILKNKLGRSYNPGRPLGMADRQRILQLYEKGHKISHIARIIGVTHSCVSKIMTRYRRTGSMYPRSAQPTKKVSIADSINSAVPIPKAILTSTSSNPIEQEMKPISPTLSLQSSVSTATEDGTSPESFIHKPIPIKSYSITT